LRKILNLHGKIYLEQISIRERKQWPERSFVWATRPVTEAPCLVHGSDNYEYSGTEKDLADRGFREVDTCSMDAGVLCTMYYSKEKECLRPETRGEQVNDIRLRLWLKECPTAAQ
jgi:hypothetical protein